MFNCFVTQDLLSKLNIQLTNLFYLHAYFLTLKERDLHVPEEELIITTDKLKEMIAELLDIEIHGLNLQKIHDALLEKEVKDEEQNEKTKNDKPKKKPMFSIKEMQREHRERQQRARNKKKN